MLTHCIGLFSKEFATFGTKPLARQKVKVKVKVKVLQYTILYDDGDIVYKEFYGNGQQDNAEKLANDKDKVVAEPVFDAVHQKQHDIVYYQV